MRDGRNAGQVLIYRRCEDIKGRISTYFVSYLDDQNTRGADS